MPVTLLLTYFCAITNSGLHLLLATRVYTIHRAIQHTLIESGTASPAAITAPSGRPAVLPSPQNDRSIEAAVPLGLLLETVAPFQDDRFQIGCFQKVL